MKDKHYKITKEEVDWYRAHPDQLERDADKRRNYGHYLLSVFLVGLGFTAASRFVPMWSENIWSSSVAEVVAEFMRDLGVSLWSAVAAIYLLEIIVERDNIRVERWYHEMKSRIAEKQ